MLIFFLFAACHISFTQSSKKIDSLLTLLKTAKEDTNKVNLLNTLSLQFRRIANYEESRKYGDDALLLAEKLNFKKGVADANNNIGITYNSQSNFDEAFDNFQLALIVYKQIDDRKGIANCYNYIGKNYYNQGSYSEAIKNFLTSLKIREEIGDKYGIADIYENIGNVYLSQERYVEALKNTLAALKIREEIGDKLSIASSYNNIGAIYDGQGNDSEALRNYKVSLKLYQESGNKYGMAASYNNIGVIYYYSQGKYPEALDNLLSAAKIFEEIGHKSGLASTYINLGELNIRINKLADSKKFLNKALSIAKEIGDKESAQDAHSGLGNLDSAMGNYRQAFAHYKLAWKYRDSLLNEENTRQIAEMREKYESEKKDKELIVLNKEKDIQALQLKKQKQTKNYFIAGLGLFIILSFFVYRNYRTRQKLKLQTLRNKIASDLHDDIGSTLSSISIFSQMAQENSKEVKPLLQTIGDSSRKMLDAMADIVWTIHPENDQFEKIIMRMRSFAYELLGARQIEFRFVADSNVANMKLSMEARRNLYLIFKEATNNMVKYSNANRAMFSIKQEQGKLVMMIKDDGKGFDSSKETQGNGLRNMKKRADEMGAVLMIDSIPGSGTTIKLEMAV